MVFLLKHLDYIYFFYGLSFVLLAGMSFLLYRNKNNLMPWSMLTLFGIFHGLNEWISMMELSTGDFLFFDCMKISVLLMSFVFLFEFGRTGLRAIYPKFFGGLSVIWQYGLLLIAVFAIHSLGVEDFDTAIRYVFGFSGGIISAVFLYHCYLSETKCRYYFLVSSICLFLFAILSGLVVNKGPFILCQYLNTDNFQIYAGFPVQILRAALMVTLTVALWEYYCFARKVQYNALMDVSLGYGKWLITAIISVLCCGWLLTMIISNSVDRSQKEDLKLTAEAIASGIGIENIKKLSGTISDMKTSDYRFIQEYLREFEGTVKDIRWFYLTKIRDGKIYFLLDSTQDNKPEYALPGTVYSDAPVDLYGAFRDGKPVICGPYTDKWGSFISAFIPLIDPETKRVYTVLGCDINSDRWSQMISLSRLQPIIITLLICIILVIAFLMHQSSLEASVIIAESEKKYRSLFNNSSDPIFILDLKGNFIEVNEIAYGKLGYDRDEFLKLAYGDVDTVEFDDFISEIIGQLKRDPQFVYETSLLAKDRTRLPVEMNAKMIDYMGAECILCIARDVSERKKIEGVLEDSEFRYRQLFNEMLSGFALNEIICDDNGTPCDYRFLEINAAFEKFTGLSRDKIIGKTVLEVLPGTEPEWISNFGNVALTGRPVFFENYHAGLGRYYEIRAFPHEKGRFAVVFNDITDRKNEEEILRYEREIISVLNQSSSIKDAGRKVLDIIIGIESVDSGGVYNVDKATGAIDLVAHKGLGIDFVKRVSHYGVESYPAKLINEGKLVFTNQLQMMLSFEDDLGLHEKIQAVAIIPLVNENQVIAVINLSSHTEKEFSPRVQKKITAITEKIAAAFLKLKITEELNIEIAERKLAEQKMRKLSVAMEQSPALIIISDFEGNIEYVNPKFVSLTGYAPDEVYGKKPDILKSGELPDGFYSEIWGCIRSGKEWRGQLHNRKKNGEFFWVAATISPIYDEKGKLTNFLSVMEDITRQKELQDQLFQSQKMESMGRLAGGIAHDFNNIIQVVNGFSELIMMKIAPESDIREDIQEIGKAARRAMDLTNQLLLFSKRKPANIIDVDVNALIANLNNMLLCALGENVRLETVLFPKLNNAKADLRQLEQVLLNLAVNAKDSMPDGGTFKIMTSNIHLDEKDLISINEAEAGDFVCISVSDTGAGLSPEMKVHLFEPFFSAKGKGKGTGLGLSIVYGIVKQHNGWLNAYSEKGKGTTFEIYLPANVIPSEKGNADSPTDASKGSAERILLVEDENSVRNLTARILKDNNYVVFTAADAIEAVEIFNREKGEFDLVLADIFLPGQDGIALIGELLRRNAGLKIIMASGHDRDYLNKRGVDKASFRFLQKPYHYNELLRAVWEVLAKKLT